MSMHILYKSLPIMAVLLTPLSTKASDDVIMDAGRNGEMLKKCMGIDAPTISSNINKIYIYNQPKSFDEFVESVRKSFPASFKCYVDAQHEEKKHKKMVERLREEKEEAKQSEDRLKKQLSEKRREQEKRDRETQAERAAEKQKAIREDDEKRHQDELTAQRREADEKIKRLQDQIDAQKRDMDTRTRN